MRIIGYGARGYIPTSMPYHLAVEAVRYVEAGSTFVPAGNFLPDRGSRKQPAENVLTERQMKVVEAVSHGFANKQIAHRLKMMDNTSEGASQEHHEEAQREEQDRGRDCDAKSPR